MKLAEQSLSERVDHPQVGAGEHRFDVVQAGVKLVLVNLMLAQEMDDAYVAEFVGVERFEQGIVDEVPAKG